MFYLPTKKVCDYFQWPDPGESKKEDIFTWYVTYDTYRRKRFFLFCNAVTGYVVRIYGIRPKEGKDPQDLWEIFLECLEESLRFDGFHPEAIAGYLREEKETGYGPTKNKDIKRLANDQNILTDKFLFSMDPQKRNQPIINHLINNMPLEEGESPLEKMAGYLEKYTEEQVLTHAAYEFDIRLELEGLLVHRRLLVPKQHTLADLHGFIQILFGWTDSHLFEFVAPSGEDYYSLPEYFPEDDTMKDAHLVSLEEAFAEKKPWTYIYDLGDYWRHVITLRRETKNLGKIPPICTDYHGPNVPEDVGGVTGYKEFLEACLDPSHEEHEESLEWFDSLPHEFFDIRTINIDLAMGRADTKGIDALLKEKIEGMIAPLAQEEKQKIIWETWQPFMDTIIAAVNLYGIIHKDKAEEIHKTYHDTKVGPNVFKDLHRKLPEYLQNHYIDTVSDYFVHEALIDNEEWETVLAKQEGKPYHQPKKEAFYRYTDPDYFEMNEAYHELLRYLETKHFQNDKQKAANFLENIVSMIQADYPMQLIVQEFTETSLSFETLEEAQDALDLLFNLHNNTRIWENRGHTPNELSKGLTPPTKEMFFEKPSSTKRPKKVGRNDPCPCGSGKKYKHCCLGENPVS